MKFNELIEQYMSEAWMHTNNTTVYSNGQEEYIVHYQNDDVSEYFLFKRNPDKFKKDGVGLYDTVNIDKVLDGFNEIEYDLDERDLLTLQIRDLGNQYLYDVKQHEDDLDLSNYL